MIKTPISSLVASRISYVLSAFINAEGQRKGFSVITGGYRHKSVMLVDLEGTLTYIIGDGRLEDVSVLGLQ
jgi:hypothetical protein